MSPRSRSASFAALAVVALVPIAASQDADRLAPTRVAAVRASRDRHLWRAALDRVREAAAGDANLAPPIVAAVEARATVGEISDTLRAVFGEHQETSTL